MRGASLLVMASAAATLLGFVPTGVVATLYAARACSLRLQSRESASAVAGAKTWLLVTIILGAAVELPVVAAMWR